MRYPHGLTSTQKQIASMKLEHPFLVAVRDIADSANGSSVFYEYVDGKPLPSLDGPVSLKQASRWTTQLANLADYLHQEGIAVFNNDSSLNRLVITEKGLMLKDLLQSDLLPADRQKRDTLIDRDARFVARVFSFLTTGEDPADTGRIAPKLPDAVAAILSHTASEVQASAQDLFRDLHHFLTQIEAPALTVEIGQRTDTGRERELNEDTVYAGQISVSTAKRPAYLCLVADGMGGHAAGEVASQDTVNSIQHDLSARLRQASTARELRAIAEQDLKWVVERANQMVWKKAQTQGTNMGTTLVAALLIGNTAYIANVGDSRAYLFRQGKLEQITADHSLVARLVAMGQLAPDQAYTHPQRNEIYRFLGQSRNVEVDVFARTLEAGDQLLLCSDGLWEMVRDPRIQHILATSANPQAACEALIEQANANGGEDNISAVVLVVS